MPGGEAGESAHVKYAEREVCRDVAVSEMEGKTRPS